MKCNITGCNEHILDIKSLYKHSYNHFDSFQVHKIVCFYKECIHASRNKKNFQKHLSRSHVTEKTEDNFKEELFIDDYEADFDYLGDHNEDSINNIDENNSELQNDEVDYLKKLTSNRNYLIKFYLTLYLKFKDKYLIAAYKCEKIFDLIKSFIKINNSNMLDLINHCEKTYNDEKTTIKIITNHLSKEKTLFEEVHNDYNMNQNKATDSW